MPSRIAREPFGDPHGPRQWRAHRRAVLGRELRMDHEQLRHLDAGFDAVQPELRGARERVTAERLAYKEALVHGDAPAARAAVSDLSRAQTRVDSLCAEGCCARPPSCGPSSARITSVGPSARIASTSERTWK